MRRTLPLLHLPLTVLLLGLAIAVPSRAQPRGSLTEEQGYDRKGNDYTNFRARGLRGCKDACDKDGRCVAYTYDTRNDVCYLKDRVNSKVRNDAMITGYRDPRAGSGGGDWGGGNGLTEEPGYDRKGNDYTNFRARGLRDCKEGCWKDRRCVAYTYDTRNDVCYLKDRINSAVRNDGMVTGYRYSSTGSTGGGWDGPGGGDDRGELNEEWAQDRKGDDYTNFRARNLDECKERCRRDRRCRAYTFSTVSNACYLKDRVNPPVHSPGKVTGAKKDRY